MVLLIHCIGLGLVRILFLIQFFSYNVRKRTFYICHASGCVIIMHWPNDRSSDYKLHSPINQYFWCLWTAGYHSVPSTPDPRTWILPLVLPETWYSIIIMDSSWYELIFHSHDLNPCNFSSNGKPFKIICDVGQLFLDCKKRLESLKFIHLAC